MFKRIRNALKPAEKINEERFMSLSDEDKERIINEQMIQYYDKYAVANKVADVVLATGAIATGIVIASGVHSDDNSTKIICGIGASGLAVTTGIITGKLHKVSDDAACAMMDTINVCSYFSGVSDTSNNTPSEINFDDYKNTEDDTFNKVLDAFDRLDPDKNPIVPEEPEEPVMAEPEDPGEPEPEG